MTADLLRAIADRTQPAGDHQLWTGPLDRTVPYIKANRRRLPVRRIVLGDALGREPIGEARATCDQPLCVAPGHLMDEVGRNNTAALEQILTALDQYMPALLAREQTYAEMGEVA